LLGLHLPDQAMMTRQILIDLKKIWKLVNIYE
jgi:hypothetical protein